MRGSTTQPDLGGDDKWCLAKLILHSSRSRTPAHLRHIGRVELLRWRICRQAMHGICCSLPWGVVDLYCPHNGRGIARGCGMV